MIYYFYYGYMASVTAYKLYEYWEVTKVVYNTCSYAYIVVNGVYKWIKKAPEITYEEELTDWLEI